MPQTSILQSANLTWDSTNNRLGIGKTNPSTTLDVSGNITALGGTINGTLNCTTGIYNSISTTGSTNVNIPSLGNFGGIGDKLILYPGTSTTYPYSLGIESNSLWMSSPNTIKLYNKGTNSFTIDVSGNVGIGTTNPGNILQVGSAGRLRISNGTTDYTIIGTTDIDGPTNTRIALSGGSRTGYNGNITYNATSTGSNIFSTTDTTQERMRITNAGNLGIGIAAPYSLLHIKGTNPALTVMAQGGSGATTQLNLSTYDTTTNLPNCSLIATDNGNYGATFQIKHKTCKYSIYITI